MLSRTFKGGIYLSLNKHLTAEKGFSNLSIPRICYIPLKQNAGNSAFPVVKTGDLVDEGQLIGRAEGPGSSNIHSSIPGKVLKIDSHPTAYSQYSLCAVIEADGRFSSSGKMREEEDWSGFDREILIKKIIDAGIVGMGGEAFPVQLESLIKDNKLSHLIINGAESEPYLTADDLLMRTYPGELIEGIKILLKILGIEKACIGIEKNKSNAITTLRGKIEKTAAKENIRVYTLKSKYPQSAEKQLIYSILRKKISPDAMLPESGIIVVSVSTVYAVREACVLNKPLFERFVTITGNIVERPGNYKIRIGTRISDIIEECGGLREKPARIIIGGPMEGIAVQSLDVPVTKETAGIVFLSGKEAREKTCGPCVRCGRCVAVCPMKLLPCDLCNAVLNGRYDLAADLNIGDCIKCGSCSYICPSGRPLTYLIKLSRGRSREEKTA